MGCSWKGPVIVYEAVSNNASNLGSSFTVSITSLDLMPQFP